ANHGADRAQRWHGSRDVDDDVEQELRLRLYSRPLWQEGPLPPRHLRPRQPRGDPACRRYLPRERRAYRDRPAQARDPADLLPLCLGARRQPRRGRQRRRSAYFGAGLEADRLDRGGAQEGPGLGVEDHRVLPHPWHAAGCRLAPSHASVAAITSDISRHTTYARADFRNFPLPPAWRLAKLSAQEAKTFWGETDAPVRTRRRPACRHFCRCVRALQPDADSRRGRRELGPL